ncbi:MAG: FAD-dependent oxidoreductase [Candidatus Omnitrophica bacterium]|nr:FAD-dependent oxidoreductase [Candidatus Omnitrophota bacterium]
MDPDLVLILGAGPAGLSAAFELTRKDRRCALVEKNSSVGGLSRTLCYDGFLTDTGPHRFFSQNSSLYGFIAGLLGDRWIQVERLTRFYINGRFYLYPVDLKEILLRMERGVSFKIARDFILERAGKLFPGRPVISFEDKVVSDFGRTLAEIVMLGYTEKIWGLPCSGISPDWITQRIKNLSVQEIIQNAFFPRKNRPKTLVDRFFYPDRGIGRIFEEMKERVTAVDGNTLNLNSYPVKIAHGNNRISEVLASNGGRSFAFEPGYLISSIPVTEFVELLDPHPPGDILRAARSLRFRSHTALFITLDKPRASNNQWIYFPDRGVAFGRVTEPKNWSAAMAPADKTSLLIEFFCWHGDEVWNAAPEDLLERALPVLEKSGLAGKKEVMRYYVHREKYAYPVYDLHYKRTAETVKNYLGSFKNLRLIGRSGRFRYNNMDHAMETGMLAARSILEDKQYDLEEAGSEQAYFERGDVFLRQEAGDE